VATLVGAAHPIGTMPPTTGPDEELTGLSERLTELESACEALLRDPDAAPDDIERLLHEQERLESRRKRLRRALLQARREAARAPPRYAYRARAGPRPLTPVRESMFAALGLLGVPAAARTVAEAAEARTGRPIDASQFASLRRSEFKSWERAPDSRPAYIVPALHAGHFEPLRGQLSSSAWPLEDRIIGPLSLRANHLRATIRVAEFYGWAKDHAPAAAARIEPLLRRLAQDVAPDAPELDPAAIAAAARAELAPIDEQDRAQRAEAARRAAALDRARQLFGTKKKEKDG
jgi:hypothetical protein